MRPVPIFLAILILGAAYMALAITWPERFRGGYRLLNLVEEPSVREERAFRRRWEERCARFVAERNDVPEGAVVLLGSSILEFLPAAKVFPGRLVVNRAIGRERFADLSERLDRTLPTARLAGAVVYFGSVNFHRGEADPELLGSALSDFLDALDRRQAKLPVMVLGVLPSRTTGPKERERLGQLEQVYGDICRARGDHVTFVPTSRDPLVDSEGRLTVNLTRDSHHLNEVGYFVLADWMCAAEGPVARALRSPVIPGSTPLSGGAPK